MEENNQQQPIKPVMEHQKKFYKKGWFKISITIVLVILVGLFITSIYLDISSKEAICKIRGGIIIGYNFDEFDFNLYDTKCMGRASDGGKVCREGSECKSGLCYVWSTYEVDMDIAEFDSDGYLLGKCSSYQEIRDCPSGDDCTFSCYIPRPVKEDEIDDVVKCKEEPEE